MIRASIKIDLSELKKYQRHIDQDLRAGGQISGGSPIANALRQWAVRYRAWIQERFLKYSRGGGDWKPIKKATARRKKSTLILQDTRTLFNALSPEFTNKPGAISDTIPFGVRVGFGGPGKYTKKGGGVGASIADVAHFHQVGAGLLPKREIIVKPDEQLLQQMAGDMERALIRMRTF